MLCYSRILSRIMRLNETERALTVRMMRLGTARLASNARAAAAKNLLIHKHVLGR